MNGTDVSGRTFGFVAHIPGNVLAGNWRIVVFLDEGASEEQQQALLDVWTGKLGGPVADLAQLIGRPRHGARTGDLYGRGGEGHDEVRRLRVGEARALQGCDRRIDGAASDTIFTTIPGSAAYVGKAEHYRVDMAKYDFDIDLEGHNAIQGSFRFSA